MNLVELLSVATLIIGTGASSYFDIKTTYIPDEITHAMLIIGAVLLFLRFPIINALVYLAIGIIVFALGFALYTFGQLGGGDVKLFTAITLLFPVYTVKMSVPSPYPPIVSVFFASAIIATFFVSGKYIIKLYTIRNRVPKFNEKLLVGVVSAFLVFIVFCFLATIEYGMIVFSVPILAGLLVYPFKDDIVDIFMLTRKKVSELTEDDIIAVDKLPKLKIKRLGLSSRRTYLDIELRRIKENAKKYKIKTVPVYDNLPTFGIYIFIGVLVVLLVGDPLFFVFSSM